MKATIQNIGNSAVLLLPEPMLAAAGMKIGDTVDIIVEGRQIVVQPKNYNPREC